MPIILNLYAYILYIHGQNTYLNCTQHSYSRYLTVRTYHVTCVFKAYSSRFVSHKTKRVWYVHCFFLCECMITNTLFNTAYQEVFQSPARVNLLSIDYQRNLSHKPYPTVAEDLPDHLNPKVSFYGT